MARAKPNVKFRRAKVDDWRIVSGIVASTWDGNDYITEAIWNEWVREEDAYLIVATLGGILAGFGRLAKLDEAEWWLEGVRVGQTQQGKGIGTAIVEQLASVFKQRGSGTLRCAVYNTNEASVHMLETNDFRHTLSLGRLEAMARPNEQNEFYKVGKKALDHIIQYWRYSPMYRICNYVEHNWVLRTLNNDHMADFLADSNYGVYIWRAFDRLHGVAILIDKPTKKDMGYEPEQVLYTGYVDAPDDTTLGDMIAALQGMAFEQGRKYVRWYMPLRSGFETIVNAEGVSLDTNHEMWVFELPRGTADLSLT